MTIHSDFDLTPYTTFKVPAKARLFAEYDSIDELRSILNDKRFAALPRLHIGGGSNLLFTKPFEGLVLHSRMTGWSREDLDSHESVIHAESGLEWDKLVRITIDEGLYGLENLAYIPGEVGASAVQNIGAYGAEAKDCILAVHTIDTVTGEDKTFTNQECRYAYRDSLFKHIPGRYIVTKVSFRLSRDKKFNLGYGPLKELAGNPDLTAKDVYEKVTAIRKSKLPEPSELGSAGSFFKNPVVPQAKFVSLKAQFPDIPHYDAPNGVKIPAGWLIEHAGLKGCRIGKAEVYPRQCLVIVNLGGATSREVVDLYTHVMQTVDNVYGITLEPEANIL